MDGAHQCIHIPGRTKEQSIAAGHDHIPDSVPLVPVKVAGIPAGRHVPVVDEHECIGCNLCALVCPVPGTITMVERAGSLGKKETWSDRVSQGRDLNPGALEGTVAKRSADGWRNLYWRGPVRV